MPSSFFSPAEKNLEKPEMLIKDNEIGNIAKQSYQS